MTARRLADLTRHERRRAITKTLIRCALAAAVILGLYFVIPLAGSKGDVRELIRLGLGVAAFIVVMVINTRSILRADLPQLRAIEAVAVAIPLFLVVFAASYVSLAHEHPASFNQPLDRTQSLYFAIVTLGTVGYGDIVPKSDFARLLVSLQILVDLVLLALVVKVVIGAAQRSLKSDR
jgi:voltage-gated potassium channel